MKNKIINSEKLDWKKVNDLIPAIIQDNNTLQVLMMGYMDKTALQQTYATGKVTFYSRTKKRTWVKGETSGNELKVVDIQADCDNDSLLMLVEPTGPCCHLNNPSCFSSEQSPRLDILTKLEMLIMRRFVERPADSYTATLFNTGINKIAQKVGEEGVEVALAGVTGLSENIKNEAADLLFHLLVLLRFCQINLMDVLLVLQNRNMQ